MLFRSAILRSRTDFRDGSRGSPLARRLSPCPSGSRVSKTRRRLQSKGWDSASGSKRRKRRRLANRPNRRATLSSCSSRGTAQHLQAQYVCVSSRSVDHLVAVESKLEEGRGSGTAQSVEGREGGLRRKSWAVRSLHPAFYKYGVVPSWRRRGLPRGRVRSARDPALERERWLQRSLDDTGHKA